MGDPLHNNTHSAPRACAEQSSGSTRAIKAPISVCHISTVHKVDDIRIFHKECRTLAAAGFDVTLIACAADVKSADVRIVALPPEKRRLSRMLFQGMRAYRAARALRADIYHFHDPELLPYGLLLKWTTCARVVFDAHESHEGDIRTKEWIPTPLRAPLAWVYGRLESFVSRRLDLIITATPHIEIHFKRIARRTIAVNNFPLRAEFLKPNHSATGERKGVCYTGAISFILGVVQVLDAFDHVDPGVMFYLAGPFASLEVEETIRGHRNWGRVSYEGVVPRSRLAQIYHTSHAGIVTFLSSPNHVHAQPTKLFEYMSAGLPVICSNFPLWRKIVEGGECGICVDPESPNDIANAINAICQSPETQRRYASNSGSVIANGYSWETEGVRLVGAYRELVSESC